MITQEPLQMIDVITKTEKEADEITSSAQEQSRKALLETEQDVERLLSDAKEAIGEQRKAALRAAEQQAAEQLCLFAKQAEDKCGETRRIATKNMAHAVDYLCRKVVD